MTKGHQVFMKPVNESKSSWQEDVVYVVGEDDNPSKRRSVWIGRTWWYRNSTRRLSEETVFCLETKPVIGSQARCLFSLPLLQPDYAGRYFYIDRMTIENWNYCTYQLSIWKSAVVFGVTAAHIAGIGWEGSLGESLARRDLVICFGKRGVQYCGTYSV